MFTIKYAQFILSCDERVCAHHRTPRLLRGEGTRKGTTRGTWDDEQWGFIAHPRPKGAPRAGSAAEKIGKESKRKAAQKELEKTTA